MIERYIIAGLAVVLGLQTLRLANEREDHADTRAAFAETARVAAVAHAQELKNVRTEEARRQAVTDQEVANAQEQRRTALAAAGRAGAAADSLRKQLAGFVSRAPACPAPADSGLPERGETAGPPVVVLADLFGRADDVAGELAAALDAAHGAGITCEKVYP